MKKKSILLVILLVCLTCIATVNAEITTCCPSSCIPSYSLGHPACPPTSSGGGADLHGWETDPDQGSCPAGQYYTNCLYGGCSYLFTEYHCGGKFANATDVCYGALYETASTNELRDPYSQYNAVQPLTTQGDFSYYQIADYGTWTVIPEVGDSWPFLVYDCTTLPTIPSNITGANITIDGIPVPMASLIPQCSFTAEPRTGTIPFNVAFDDTSTNIVNPQIEATYWEWIVRDSDTLEDLYYPYISLQDWTGVMDQFGKEYDVGLTVGNVFGYCNINSPRHINTGTSTNAAALNIYIIDAITNSLISDSTAGLKNITSGEWVYKTKPSGVAQFLSTDATPKQLKVGQSVEVSGAAYGYTTNNITLTIPYSGYNFYVPLYPTGVTPDTGYLFLTVKVTKNEDGTPLNSAVVQVSSGGNYYEHYTDETGITTFQNITSSTSLSVTAFAQAYAEQSKVLPVTSNYMNTSFSLVRVGATPVTTPMTPSTTQTTLPTTTYTDNTGKPVSVPEGQALDAFAQLAAALGDFFRIGIWIILIWLMWVLVYEITGGRVIDKIMRRGRGGRGK